MTRHILSGHSTPKTEAIFYFCLNAPCHISSNFHFLSLKPHTQASVERYQDCEQTMISRKTFLTRLLVAASIVPSPCAVADSLRRKVATTPPVVSTGSATSGLNFEAKLQVVEQSSETLLFGGWVQFEVEISEPPKSDTILVMSTVCQQDLDYTFAVTEEYDGSGSYSIPLEDSQFNVAEDKPWRNHNMAICQVRLIAIYDHFVDVDGVDAYRSHVMDSSLFIVQGENAKTIQLR
jgi:hypothetical protein